MEETTRVIKTSDGVKIACDTKGASIGYQVVKPGKEKVEMHKVTSWDLGILFNPKLKNGQEVPAAPVWQVYNGERISLNSGDTIKVNAMRIGYRASTLTYLYQ